MDEVPQEVKDHLAACVDLIGRTGAQDFQIRYCDEEQPIVWIAVAGYRRPGDSKSGNPAKRAEQIRYEVGGAMTPEGAAFRLVETLVDGGTCQHCRRPTGVDENWAGGQLLDQLVCWYVYDPELKKFRRGCE